MRLGQVELLPQRQGGKAPYHLFLQLSTCGRELCLHFKITLPQLHTRFQSKAQKGTEVIQGPLEQPVQQVALVLRAKRTNDYVSSRAVLPLDFKYQSNRRIVVKYHSYLVEWQVLLDKSGDDLFG